MDARPPSAAPRLLQQVRERVRYLHYSLRTEQAYVYWIRFFVRWHGLRHPRDMGAPEVEALLTMLATQRSVSSSTHNQALSALLQGSAGSGSALDGGPAAARLHQANSHCSHCRGGTGTSWRHGRTDRPGSEADVAPVLPDTF